MRSARRPMQYLVPVLCAHLYQPTTHLEAIRYACLTFHWVDGRALKITHSVLSSYTLLSTNTPPSSTHLSPSANARPRCCYSLLSLGASSSLDKSGTWVAKAFLDSWGDAKRSSRRDPRPLGPVLPALYGPLDSMITAYNKAS
jgi:hypothetical protein